MGFRKTTRASVLMRRIALLVAAASLALLLAGSERAAAARRREPPTATEEWPRLCRVWQAMLDHSSGVTTSPTLCRELAKELDAADADLTALAGGGALSKGLAEQLRRLMHRRYVYLLDCHYAERSGVRVSAAEARVTAAHWVIELQLSLLRRRPTSKEEEQLAEAAKSNLVEQLTFLHHVDEFEAEADSRRLQLRAREKEGETVDWKPFEAEYQIRSNRLLDANRMGALPRVREVEELIPYLVSLTREGSGPRDGSSATARPGS